MAPPGFAGAFQLWLGFLAGLGFRADAHLNPPAASEAIAGAEAEIGFRFPDDLRALYLHADGQRETIRIADPAAGDPVHAEYWRPGWFPFANDGGGNAYAVDLSPAPGGRYGQVILIGRDEDERRVLAPGLAEFLAGARRLGSARLDIQGHWASFDSETGR